MQKVEKKYYKNKTTDQQIIKHYLDPMMNYTIN